MIEEQRIKQKALMVIIRLALTAVALAIAPSGATPQSRSALMLRSDSIVRVAKAQAHSVVSLHTIEGRVAGDHVEGIGSAVVIDRNGLLLTNAHVVEGAEIVHVRTTDGRDIDATVIGRDGAADLALLRVSEPLGLVPVLLGDSDRLEVGAFVVAIGSPFGLDHTVSAGILSAKARGRDNSGLEFLQTDAVVNAGSSEGGLFDLEGRLVGITNAILAPPGGGNVGLNFAIPVAVIKTLLPRLRTGTVRHGWLGVSTRGTRAPGDARPNSTSGAMEILDVAPEGPAAAAGVVRGDFLLGALVSGRRIPPTGIHRSVWLAEPGTRIGLSIWRNGQVQTLTVMLGSLAQVR